MCQGNNVYTLQALSSTQRGRGRLFFLCLINYQCVVKSIMELSYKTLLFTLTSENWTFFKVKLQGMYLEPLKECLRAMKAEYKVPPLWIRKNYLAQRYLGRLSVWLNIMRLTLNYHVFRIHGILSLKINCYFETSH